MAQKKKNTASKKFKISRFSFMQKPKALVALVFIVAFASFGAYKVVDSYAADSCHPYKCMGSHKGVSVKACKTKVNAYGGVYQVRALFTKSKSTPNRFYAIQAMRNGSLVQSSGGSYSYWNGTVGSAMVNASIPLNDKWGIILDAHDWWTVGPLNPANLPNCPK